MTHSRRPRLLVLLVCAGTMALAGCGGGMVGEARNEGYPQKVGKEGREERVFAPTISEAEEKGTTTIFGKGGLFSTDKGSSSQGGGSGIGVNSFLWRATLDTISFMPVNSADPFGGVIITDWHSPPETPNERFKVNIYIIGRTLRADGVKVAVFRQMRDPSGGTWRDANTPQQTATSIEDAILMKARQMRNNVALQ